MSRPDDDRLLYSISAAADKLSISRSSAYALVQSGALPVVTVAGVRRVHPADLEAYADGLRHRAAHLALAMRGAAGHRRQRPDGEGRETAETEVSIDGGMTRRADGTTRNAKPAVR